MLQLELLHLEWKEEKDILEGTFVKVREMALT